MTFRTGVTKTVSVLVVAAIVVAAFVYTALQPAIGHPDEKRRVRHPAGFSIIQPEDWDLTIQLASPSRPAAIQTLPKKPEGRPGPLSAAKLGSKPVIPIEGKRAMREGQFQGKPAWVREDTEHQKLWTRVYVFERDGEWYQVALQRPAPEPIMGEEWSAYVESFRVERQIGLPTSMPSAPPAEGAAGPAIDLTYDLSAVPATAPSAGTGSPTAP